MGISFSTATAKNMIENDAVQQFAGVCDFQCINNISNVDVDIINSRVTGGINFKQYCSVDASCSISTNMDAVTDTVAKATSSTNAKDSGFLDTDVTTSESVNQIRQYIQQKVYDSCKVTSTNDIKNVDIFAVNSDIEGGINFGQSGSTKGNCTFDTIMKAVEDATATTTANATSGKDKKGEKCGSCSGIEVTATYIGIGILVIIALVVLAFVAKHFLSGTSGKPTGTSTGKPSLWSRLTSKSNTTASPSSSISTPKA